MSEEVKEVEDIRLVHVFYCDVCGKKIMESTELDDGWYPEPAKVEESIFINYKRKWYEYESGHLCKKCLEKERGLLFEKLMNIGFKERRS